MANLSSTVLSILTGTSLFVLPCTHAANVQSVFTYPSSVTQQSGDWINLKAELNYNNSVTNAPIAVVMHGYSASRDIASIRANAQRLRDAGFFAISVTMREREGSQGVRDSGGVEIYDIYDAVEAVKVSYALYVNPANLHITGYSGGGGNTMSALVKFPDYFCLGSSFFGMSDYGLDLVNGWYNNGANYSGLRTPQLDADIGNPNTGGPLVLDKYRARASNFASKNNPYSEIHLFVNWDEPICPAVNSISSWSNAVAAQSFPGEFTNSTVHLGTNGVYHDFNTNGLNEATELQYWLHGNSTASQQASTEAWYLTRLKNGLIPRPRLNDSDELYVAGWVKTRPFEFWLGDGQNAAGTLNYSLSPVKKQFSLGILSSVKIVTGRLKMDTSDMSGLPVEVWMNGVLAANFIGGGVYIYNAMGDGQTIALTVPVTLPSATPTEMFFELARRNAAGSDQSGRAVDDQRGHRPAQDYTDKCATVLSRKSPLIYL
ncbi:MAG: prolyl oligopeptidase family serine peptidase [Verrucomicrobiota bacterium]